MRKIALTIFISVCLNLLCYNQAVAQSSLTVLKAPDRIFLMEEVDSVRNNVVSLRNDDNWEVYANREACPIYASSNKNSTLVRNASFLEGFYVIVEEDQWVRVIEQGKVNGGHYNPNAVLGWINKKDLILFTEGFKLKSLAYKKAMFTRSMASLYEDFDVNFYANPSCNVATGEEASNTINNYFVYDETPNAVLLGSTQKFIGSPEDIIKGWVKKSSMVFWNTKVCMEPNYREYAQNDRLSNPFTGFLPNTYDVLWAERAADVSNEPWPANNLKRRITYISSDDNDIRGGFTIKPPNDPSDNMIIVRYIDSLITVLSPPKMNIVFVIDGTASMANAFHAVGASIEEIASTVERDLSVLNQKYNTEARLEWGAVVYRDADSREQFQIQPLGRLSSAELIDSLAWENVVGKDSPDNSVEEAVFMGLKKGLDLFEGKETENNLIVMIGDAGDHHRGDFGASDATTISMDDLIYEINTANVNLFNYQFQNRPNVQCTDRSGVYTYPEYVEDFKDIMSQTQKEIDITVTVEGDRYPFNSVNNTETPIEIAGTSVGLVSYSTNSYLTQKLTFLRDPNNTIIPQNDLVELVVSDINDAIKGAYSFDMILRNILTHEGGLKGILRDELGIELNRLSAEGPITRARIFTIVYLMSRFEEIFNPKEDFYKEGDISYNSYRKVIMFDHFISHENLGNLLSRFETVNNQQTPEDLVGACVEMFAQITGIEDVHYQGANWNDILTVTIVEFLGKVLDMPMMRQIANQNYPNLIGLTIGDLLNPDNYDLVIDIMDRFKKSYSDVFDLLQNNDMVYDRYNGTRFYYLPTDVYPYCDIH